MLRVCRNTDQNTYREARERLWNPPAPGRVKVGINADTPARTCSGSPTHARPISAGRMRDDALRAGL